MARRGRLGLLSVAVGVTLTFAALPGQAETLRSGLSRAQLAKVVPYVGIPSVGAGAGVAQAEIQGASAHASAGLADFGSMAMILGAVASKAPVPLPDLPSPITADDRDHPDVSRDPVTASATPPPAPPATPPSTTPPSTTPPSTTPPSTTPSSTTAAAANPARASLLAGLTAEPASTTTTTTTAPAAVPPAVTPAAPAAAWEEAHASKAPASRATVRGPELGVPGVVMFTGAESRASADGGVSSSTVTLGRLVLGGANGAPEVALSNLVWTARQAMARHRRLHHWFGHGGRPGAAAAGGGRPGRRAEDRERRARAGRAAARGSGRHGRHRRRRRVVAGDPGAQPRNRGQPRGPGDAAGGARPRPAPR